MPSYNIGDIVIVREDLEDGEYYGEVYVTEEMADLAGCAVTITDVFQDGQRIKVRETDRYDYVWKPEMFSGLAPDYLYHKGDVVAIRDDLDEYETYRMLSGIRTGECQRVTTEMQRMAGQAVTISGMYSGQYKIQEDEGEYLWTDEMFSGYAREIEASTDEEMMSLFGMSQSEV